MIHDESYWTNRYNTGQVQWDTGAITTPLRTYFDGLEDKSLSILIPGSGNAYEAKYLWENGFKNVFVADISKAPLDSFKQTVPDFPEDQLLHIDFFKIDQQFDLIVEQTFFCALHPSQRGAYVSKMYELLKPGGFLMGVLFDDPLFNDHPPYGGDENDYLPLFKDVFDIRIFEPCYNSIKPRKGRELFILLQRSP